jgi:hypothetical protein
LGVAENPKGGTVAVSFLGLSLSLKKKSFDIKKKKKSQEWKTGKQKDVNL